MNALGTLARLKDRDTSKADNDPPQIIIESGLPDGYYIVNYGCAFYYRRNQSEDPEVVTVEADPIAPGDSRTVRGTRRDCCRLVVLGVDVQLPNGNEVPVFANAEAPSGKCILQEKFKLEVSKSKTSSSVVMSIQ